MPHEVAAIFWVAKCASYIEYLGVINDQLISIDSMDTVYIYIYIRTIVQFSRKLMMIDNICV